jgi:hypothetical protein
MRIFFEAKDRREDFPRGVVDGGEEHEPRSAVLEPGMMTAIHLDQQPDLGHALAAAAMPGRAALPWTTDAGGTEKPLHGLPGHVEALALGQVRISPIVITDFAPS